MKMVACCVGPAGAGAWRAYAPLQGEEDEDGERILARGEVYGPSLSMALALKVGAEHQGVFLSREHRLGRAFLDSWSCRRDLGRVVEGLEALLGSLARGYWRRKLASAMARWYRCRNPPVRLKFYVPPSRMVMLSRRLLQRKIFSNWRLYAEWASKARLLTRARGWRILRLLALKTASLRRLAWNKWVEFMLAERKRLYKLHRTLDRWKLFLLEQQRPNFEDPLRKFKMRRALLRWQKWASDQRSRRIQALSDYFRRWLNAAKMRRLLRSLLHGWAVVARDMRMLRDAFCAWRHLTGSGSKSLGASLIADMLRRRHLQSAFYRWKGLPPRPVAVLSAPHRPGMKNCRCVKCLRRYGRLGAREARRRNVPDKSGIVVSESLCHVNEHLLIRVQDARRILRAHEGKSL